MSHTWNCAGCLYGLGLDTVAPLPHYLCAYVHYEQDHSESIDIFFVELHHLSLPTQWVGQVWYLISEYKMIHL